MNYLLAHDLGTSGDKVTLFDENGTLINNVTIPYHTHYHHTNWADQNPEEWWDVVCKGTRIVIENIDPGKICAVSFSGHMMGCLCVDANGSPLYPSIIWSDQRAESEFIELQRKVGAERMYKITGHRGSANYTLPKLMWLKKHEPEIYANTHKVLQCKDYIVYKLTGRFATEPTDGVGTLAMNIVSHEWSAEMLEGAGISQNKFPESLKSIDVAGGVTKEAAQATGLREGTKVVMGGGDGIMGAIGTGTVKQGQAFMSLGSSAWVSVVSERPMFDDERRNSNSPHVIDGLYLNEGVMQSAGNSWSWARKIMGGNNWSGIDDVNHHLGEMVASVPPGSNGVMFLPYLMGERCPWWDPEAKGAFIGMKMETTTAEMLRAVMEGVAFHMGYICKMLRENGSELANVTVVGGGTKNLLWRQILADTMNVNFQVPHLLEGATSFGAAIVGGVGIGLYENFEDATSRFCSIDQVTHPDERAVEFYKQKIDLFARCYEALAPLYRELH